jgi:hypothetical protein
MLPRTNPDDEKSKVKAEAAKVFKDILDRVKRDEEYIRLAQRHREQYEQTPIPADTSQFEEDMDAK